MCLGKSKEGKVRRCGKEFLKALQRHQEMGKYVGNCVFDVALETKGSTANEQQHVVPNRESEESGSRLREPPSTVMAECSTDQCSEVYWQSVSCLLARRLSGYL